LLSDLPPGGHRKSFDTIGDAHGTIGGLEMSPDGLHLTYDADGAIYVVGSDGSGLRRLSDDQMICRHACFSEDGDRIAYVADGKLCTADLHSGANAVVTGDQLQIEDFHWT
jgi:hypothetical protein